MKKMCRCLFLLFMLTGIWPGQGLAAIKRVANSGMLQVAIKEAAPGDSIIMSPGTWNDIIIDFQAEGTTYKPIVLMAEQDSAVFISGRSALKIGGRYLVVSGLIFQHGYAPGNAVIEFRSGDQKLAGNCRVSNFIIRNYSKPNRFDNDNWVLLWGKNNRLDHCTFEDKLNTGPTVVVNLNDERSQQNRHRIDHNYFKGRQRFGSNGGETLRIGVSRYSLTASETLVDHNYFERCNGEVEIISVKSGNNIIDNNFFYECEGGVVLRHGDNNIVRNNFFNGNNKEFTGGIRIVNSGHVVHNNVLIGLSGERFRSALTIMNGVPNSLINRYYQVQRTAISNNTFVNCRQVLLGGGKDAERTLGPVSTRLNNNIFFTGTKTIINDENSDGGISFTENLASGSISYVGLKAFDHKEILFHNWHGISMPANDGQGANLSKIDWLSVDSVGAFYRFADKEEARQPAVKLVLHLADYTLKTGEINRLKDGDTVLFADAAAYGLASPIGVHKKLVFQGTKNDTAMTTLFCQSAADFPALIQIENGGSLVIENIAFDGARDGYGEAAAGIATTGKAMNQHYSLWADGCTFYHFNEGGYSGIRGGKGTFADTVALRNCIFRNISGTAVNFADEKEDKGIYNVDYLSSYNCRFFQVLNAGINVYRGGNDESTTGPKVAVTHCVFSEVDNKEQGVVLKLIGVQDVTVCDNIFDRSGQGGRSIWLEEFRWDKVQINNNHFYKSGRVQQFNHSLTGKNFRYHQQAPLHLLRTGLGATKGQ